MNAHGNGADHGLIQGWVADDPTKRALMTNNSNGPRVPSAGLSDRFNGLRKGGFWLIVAARGEDEIKSNTTSLASETFVRNIGPNTVIN